MNALISMAITVAFFVGLGAALDVDPCLSCLASEVQR